MKFNLVIFRISSSEIFWKYGTQTHISHKFFDTVIFYRKFCSTHCQLEEFKED